MKDAPILLDVTRLVSRGWTKRRSTGIDRVCEAYCLHFQDRARAVIQHRGVVRVLSAKDSKKLFGILLQPDEAFHAKALRFAPIALARSPSLIDGRGALYINTSHTDFDLTTHHEWVEKCNLRAVYFLHDLIPLTHPELTTAHAVKRHLGRVRGAIRHGFATIVNTQATKDELKNFADDQRLDLPPVLVAPLAGGKLDQAQQAPAKRTSEAKPTGDKAVPYFVSIGTIERRKNYRMLLRIWGELARDYGKDCPRLVIAGQIGKQSEEILYSYHQDSALRRVVDFRTSATDAELGAALRGARALLMPTHAEGYGLPVVEALGLGTPVIASDIPSFREIGQNIPKLLPVSDEAQWKQAIVDFAFSDMERDKQINQMARFEAPTWDSHFSILDPWLERLSKVEQAKTERIEVEC